MILFSGSRFVGVAICGLSNKLTSVVMVCGFAIWSGTVWGVSDGNV